VNCTLFVAERHTDDTSNEVKVVKSIAVVKYNYEAQQTDELALTKDSQIQVLEKSLDGWWKGQMNDQVGWFPSNYVIEQPLSAAANGQSIANVGNLGAPEVPSNANPSSLNRLNANLQSLDLNSSGSASLEQVVALYSFASQNEEELSFEKGERLDIVDKPADDPDWWMARNRHGESGLVPQNYVHVLDANERSGNDNRTAASSALDDKMAVIKSQIWYYGAISRGQCDQLLNEFGENGDFLIRDSETNVSVLLLFG
jgi:hypothetical protein